MSQFWLNDFPSLFSLNNFNLTSGNKINRFNKLLNLSSLIVLIIGLTLAIIKKNPIYFGISIIVLSFIILTFLFKLCFTNNLINLEVDAGDT